jgi:hypothetical protein
LSQESQERGKGCEEQKEDRIDAVYTRTIEHERRRTMGDVEKTAVVQRHEATPRLPPVEIEGALSG